MLSNNSNENISSHENRMREEKEEIMLYEKEGIVFSRKWKENRLSTKNSCLFKTAWYCWDNIWMSSHGAVCTFFYLSYETWSDEKNGLRVPCR